MRNILTSSASSACGKSPILTLLCMRPTPGVAAGARAPAVEAELSRLPPSFSFPMAMLLHGELVPGLPHGEPAGVPDRRTSAADGVRASPARFHTGGVSGTRPGVIEDRGRTADPGVPPHAGAANDANLGAPPPGAPPTATMCATPQPANKGDAAGGCVWSAHPWTVSAGGRVAAPDTRAAPPLSP